MLYTRGARRRRDAGGSCVHGAFVSRTPPKAPIARTENALARVFHAFPQVPKKGLTTAWEKPEKTLYAGRGVC